MARRSTSGRAAATPTRGRSASSNTGKKDTIEAQLAELENIYDEAEEQDFGDIDTGTYQVKVDKAVIENAKSSGNLQVTCDLTIVGPTQDFTGRKLWKRMGIFDNDNIGRFKGDMARLGLEAPKTLKELPDWLGKELEGSYAEVGVSPQKDNPDFNNVKWRRSLDAKDIPSNGSAGSGRRGATAPAPAAAPERGSRRGAAAPAPVEEPTSRRGRREPEPAPAVEEASEECTATFDVKEFTRGDIKDIEAFAGDLDFKLADYENNLDLVLDMAEHVGITGDFKKPGDLLDELDKAIKEEAAKK